MSERHESGATPVVSRRDFVRGLAATAGVLLGGSVSCGGGGGTPVTPPPPTQYGEISGMVSDLGGAPQPSLGVLILMNESGRQTGDRATPDASGHYHFHNITPGNYQIRFHAPGVAVIPEPFSNPIRLTVRAGETTDVPVRVKLGNYNSNLVEIYAGEGFFQLQPDGAENAETVVKLGTLVCWYNVDTQVHTVTGGPWVDSGDLQRSQAYIWTADQTGLFAFHCKYHQPGMRGTLRVIS